MVGEDRRIDQPFEHLGRPAHFAGVHADVGPREQGVEPLDRVGGEPGMDDPETGFVGEVGAHLLGELRGDDHRLEIVAEAHLLDLAHDDILVFDHRFVGLDAGGGFEADFDGGSFFAVGFGDEDDPDEQGDDRNDPDRGEAPAFPGIDGLFDVGTIEGNIRFTFWHGFPCDGPR